MKKCGFFAQFFESRDADAVYTCLQRSSTTFRHFQEKLSWCRTFKVGPAPKNGQLRRSKSRSPLTSGLTDWIGIVEWPFHFRDIESNLSALPPIWRESRFCNTYIRVFPLKFPSWSDPQVGYRVTLMSMKKPLLALLTIGPVCQMKVINQLLAPEKVWKGSG